MGACQTEQKGRTGSSGVILGFVCDMQDGGGRRIIRRAAPHPAGRAEARCLAMLDPNLNRRFSSLSPQNRKLRYQSGIVCNIRDGGGRRIIRRAAPHPAGRAEARCLAMLDPNLNRRFSSLSPQNRKLRCYFGIRVRYARWWWEKDSNLRSL